jgi:hypothetical protein
MSSTTAQSAPAAAIRTSDKVWISPAVDPKCGGVWTVVKVNPTTYSLERGNGMRLRASHFYVEHATAEQIAADPPAAEVPYFVPGTVVRSSNPRMAGLFVVLSTRAKVKVVKLGGDGGRTWTVPNAASLSAVPLGEVAQVLGA